MLKILQEALCYAFLYSMFIVIMCVKQGPKKQIYNYPSSIQNRLIKLGITSKEEIKKNACMNKIFGILVMFSMSLFMICGMNKETRFIPSFLEAYLFINMFSLFDVIFIDCIWFCHSRFWIIKGTEDMINEYKDYKYHWKYFFKGLLINIPACFIISGLLVSIYILFKN